MNPSQPNTNTGASCTGTEPIGLTNIGQRHGLPADSSFQSSHHSAPLLPSGPYNPGVMNLEPPSYNWVIAQDASDSNNRFGSSPTGNLHRAYNQAPYPTGSRLHSVTAYQAPYRHESMQGLRSKGFGEVTAPKPENHDQETQEQFDHVARQDAERQEKIITVIVVLGLCCTVAAVLALIKRVMTIHS